MIRWRYRAHLAASALVLVTVSAAGCATPREQALDNASERVRATAEGLRIQVEDLAASPDGPRDTTQLGAYLDAELPAGPTAESTGVGVDPDGAAVVGRDLLASAEAGGGMSYAGVTARLCVQYVVRPGPPVSVEIRQAACDPVIRTGGEVVEVTLGD